MTVYILKHPSPDFSGFVGGVDFYHGMGSTSSIQDAKVLAEIGLEVYADGKKVEIVKVEKTIEINLTPLEPRTKQVFKSAVLEAVPVQEEIKVEGPTEVGPPTIPVPVESPPEPKFKRGRRPKK